MNYTDQWDLEGITSSSLDEEMARLQEAIAALEHCKSDISLLVQKMQEIDLAMRQIDAFILCLQSQNIHDDAADKWRAEFTVLESNYQKMSNALDTLLLNCKPEEIKKSDVRFVLEERKLRAAQKLPAEKEDLITELAIDGYHGWGEIYPVLVGEIKIPFEKEELSFGQAENKLSHPDRNVRKSLFLAQEEKWKKNGKVFAQVLNHLAGFRLHVYAMRGWNDPVQEPLFENRMSAETLNAMWNATLQQQKPLLKFLETKAKLLGLNKLSWYDLETPLFEKEGSAIPYAQGAKMIIDHFSQFHLGMGEFAKNALENKWIEASDRPGKRPGGFCVALPKARQSRIFMTYSGTMVNLSTLAHELGHAYHNAMVEDLPSFSQHYRMNVAETASTFAEQLISDALLSKCNTREEKLKILSDRVQRSIAFMMNIRARFLFEKQFYEARKSKYLSADELCALMQSAQETAYGNALEVWHPYFWASKLHFYFTGVPFYNFPYTFGYLFSLGIYARAKKEGKEFASAYDALLKDSGMMSVEDLAKKHLGVDLTKPAFWDEAVGIAIKDVDEFFKIL